MQYNQITYYVLQSALLSLLCIICNWIQYNQITYYTHEYNMC